MDFQQPEWNAVHGRGRGAVMVVVGDAEVHFLLLLFHNALTLLHGHLVSPEPGGQRENQQLTEFDASIITIFWSFSGQPTFFHAMK